MTTVTSLDLLIGGPAVHITVSDQNDVPLPPADGLAWASLPGVSIVSDSTGFMFSAEASATVGSTVTSAVYTGVRTLSPIKGPDLMINIAAQVIPVTALQYSSP